MTSELTVREACNRKAGDSWRNTGQSPYDSGGHCGDSKAQYMSGRWRGRGLLALIEMWMVRFPIEYRGNTKALERIYKMVGEGISCFLGKSGLLKKKGMLKEELVSSGYRISVLQGEKVLEICCTPI